jgi:hypothetical protein
MKAEDAKPTSTGAAAATAVVDDVACEEGGAARGDKPEPGWFAALGETEPGGAMKAGTRPPLLLLLLKDGGCTLPHSHWNTCPELVTANM